jgi:AcrR family transcriptional regulator/DNA-binding MarR family transcriptional regulator
VEEIQRSRILQAMAHEVALRGPTGVTVARVIARSGVSRRAFYSQFSDVEACFLAAFDVGVEQLRARASAAYGAEPSWREGVRAALAAILRYLEDEPLLARLCVVHASGAGPRVLEHRARVIAEASRAVDLGRRQRTASREPPPIVAEGVVGAVLAVLYNRLTDSGAPDAGELAATPALIDLHGQLASIVVLPYLGASTAARELDRSPPQPTAPPAASKRRTSGRGLVDLPGGRLTYRTVQVLRAIAQHPGASNREISQRAGIVDQGQISKILGRLQEQGLIVNKGGSAQTRGTPNAWWLTRRGETLEQTLREPSGRPQPGNGSGSRRPAI